jgi:hypothetical protein
MFGGHGVFLSANITHEEGAFPEERRAVHLIEPLIVLEMIELDPLDFGFTPENERHALM